MGKHDWKKTLWKSGRVAALVILAGAAAQFSKNPYYLALAPVLELLRNWLKYKSN